MHAKAQKESIVSISRSRSVASTTSTGATTGTGGAAPGGNVGSAESGSVGVVRLGSIANAAPGEALGKGLTGEDCGSTESGSVGKVRLGSFAKGDVEAGAETTTETETETAGTAAAPALEAAVDGTAMTGAGAGGSDERGSAAIVKLDSFPHNDIEAGVSAAENAGGATVGGKNGDNKHTTPGQAGGIVVGKGGGSVQGGQAHLVRHGSFARSKTRLGRVDHKLRRSQRHRRKAHHYLMSLTYSGLQPGMEYHIRVAGISSVGQVSRTVWPLCLVRQARVRGDGGEVSDPGADPGADPGCQI